MRHVPLFRAFSGYFAPTRCQGRQPARETGFKVSGRAKRVRKVGVISFFQVSSRRSCGEYRAQGAAAVLRAFVFAAGRERGQFVQRDARPRCRSRRCRGSGSLAIRLTLESPVQALYAAPVLLAARADPPLTESTDAPRDTWRSRGRTCRELPTDGPRSREWLCH